MSPHANCDSPNHSNADGYYCGAGCRRLDRASLGGARAPYYWTFRPGSLGYQALRWHLLVLV